MTVRDIQVVELLLCAADICLSQPHEEFDNALLTAQKELEYKDSVWCVAYDEVLAAAGTWVETLGREAKGVACLEAAQRIEEQRGILR